MEQWRNIKGYENYQVSNCGRVKSLNYNKTGKERILKAGNNNGYLFVYLCKNGRKKKHWIHRLVAQAFIDNPDNLPCVNHKDENPSNNCIENLEWCNHIYNINYGTAPQRMSQNHKKVVYQYSLDGELIAEYPSVKEAAQQLGYSKGNLSNACTGRYETAYGYKWAYNKLIDYSTNPQ